MPEAPFDQTKAHRWFGVEFNNRAWDLLEKPDRTDVESAAMLHCAHAALLHWSHVGTAANRQRGYSLLATVYAALGKAEPAVEYAGHCLNVTEQAPDLTAFDRAAAAAAASLAYQCAGEASKAETYRSRALGDAQTLDEEEKAVLLQILRIGQPAAASASNNPPDFSSL